LEDLAQPKNGEAGIACKRAHWGANTGNRVSGPRFGILESWGIPLGPLDFGGHF